MSSQIAGEGWFMLHSFLLGTAGKVENVGLVLVACRESIRRVVILVARVVVKAQAHKVDTVLLEYFKAIIGLAFGVVIQATIILNVIEQRYIATLYEIKRLLRGTEQLQVVDFHSGAIAKRDLAGSVGHLNAFDHVFAPCRR